MDGNVSGKSSSTYLSGVFVFAVVRAPHDWLLLPHPRLGLVGVSEVLLGLQRVLQILSPLGRLGLQCVPTSVKLSQLRFDILPSKVPWVRNIFKVDTYLTA